MPESDVILEAGDLRVVFFRQADRYAHRAELWDAARQQWIAALESLEGAAGDEWPPSPPWQQLHVEHRPTGRVVLLIGMAGRTHWSAAVEVGGDGKSIRFDVAARVQNVPQRLGSEYRLPAAIGTGGAAEPGRVRIVTASALGQAGWRVESTIDRPPPATVAWNYALER